MPIQIPWRSAMLNDDPDDANAVVLDAESTMIRPSARSSAVVPMIR
jgi:hypothetical protein